MKNGFEAAARYRKVMALCALIPVGESQEAIERTADFFEHISDAQWQTLANAAGVRLPSAETRRVVVATLKARQPLSVIGRAS